MSEVVGAESSPVEAAALDSQVGESGDAVEQMVESVEAAPQEEKQTEEPKKPDQFASKFAALTRKERMIKEQQAQMQRAMEELERRAKEIEERGSKYSGIEDQIKKQPLKFLEQYGLSFDDLTKIALNEGAPTPEMQIKYLEEKMEKKYETELKKLREELEEKEKRQEEEKLKSTVENFKQELASFVNGTEKYELIRANDAVDLVYDVIEEHFNETGRVLSNEEASNYVEEYLEGELERLLKLEKVKSKVGPKQTEQAKPVKKDSEPSMTLSNALSAQAPTKGERKMSYEESLAEAAKLIRWEE